jgi:hypothetical protein
MLDKKFNLDNFSDWIEEFLPDFSRDLRKVEVPNGFSDVNSIKTLGESSLGVRVFIIETSKDPSGRKVGLAKDSFNLIKNYGTPNALIAYYSENSDNWRFSLLTSTPVWNDGKIITKLSNPKRHSYVLGPNAKVNTPTKFLLKLGKALDFNDLKSRFSLEVVNKEFYKEISESFTKLVGGTRGEGRNKKTYESLLKLPLTNDYSKISTEFAVRLVGRVIFCWFLKEKVSESGISLMPKELLSLNAISDNSDYYHKILEPIFFEVLNKPIKSRKDGFASKSFSQIPYLNGGLFSPHDDDFFSYNEGKEAQFHNTVVVPDEWFKELLGILETYNFTIDENTSTDEELSIDPEMLGRIFENLLAEINPETGESARKSTGSYYTPRDIVDYMVDESLLLYLKQKTTIDVDKLKAIISYDLSDDSSYPLKENEKEELVEAIEKVKILDPACGSGAFPIGALQKIVFILQQADPNGQIWFKRQLAKASPEFRKEIEKKFSNNELDFLRKIGIIKESIFGVDIQPIATEIARLRCFLTLIVDEIIKENEENRGIKPLPNLDFKFVTANSLISLPKSEGLFAIYEDLDGIGLLKQIRDEYFNSSGIDRAELVSEFYKTQKEIGLLLEKSGGQGYAEMSNALRKWDPFSHKTSSWFDPEWMFGVKSGFDIIIANPPYKILTKNNTDADMYDYFIKHFLSIKGSYSKNLYVLFIEKFISHLKPNANLCFIVPEGLYQTRSYKPCVDLMNKSGGTKTITSFTNYVFENAVTGNLIFLFQDGWKGETLYFHFEGDNTLTKIKKNESKLLPKIEFDSVMLGDITELFKGMVVKDRDDVVFNERKPEMSSFLLGKHISRWNVHSSNYAHYKSLQIVGGTKKIEKHNHIPRILIRRTGDTLCCAYLKELALTESTLYSCWTNSNLFSNEYILALLNSKLLDYYTKERFITNQQGYPQILMTDLALLPIKKASVQNQKPLVDIVNKILALTSSVDYLNNPEKKAQVEELEKLVNRRVYELYDLTEEEIKIVDGESNNESN